jgi:outer membrane protein TolC
MLNLKNQRRILAIMYMFTSVSAVSIAAQSAENYPLETLNMEDYAKHSAQGIDEAIAKALEKKEAAIRKLNLKLPDARPNKSGQEVTISDIRSTALANNIGLKVYQLDPIIAATMQREERAKFDNIIFANINYSQKDKPSSSLGAVKFSSNNPDLNSEELKLSSLESEGSKLQGEIGLLIPLRTGAKVKVSTPFERSESDYSTAKFNSKEYASALKFSITQPLLRNAGIDVNEASIRIADIEHQAVDAKTKLQAIKILSTVEKAYWALNRSWDELEVRQRQHEYATQNLDMVRKRVKEGLSAAIEVNRAEIGVADRMEALIIANTKLKMADRLLKFYLNETNNAFSSDVYYITSSKAQLNYFDLNRTKMVEKALSNRLELMELELKLSADLNKINYLENQLLPIFNLEYQYGALSDVRNNFGQSYSSMRDGQLNEWSVGFNVELPISNEARKAQLERATLTRQQRLANQTLQALTIKKEILDTADEIDQNWQRIIAARQQVVIAGVNYEAELKQFKEGLRTMTEVIESLTRLGDAQIKEINALNDYQASKIDLAYATGTILGYSNIEAN